MIIEMLMTYTIMQTFEEILLISHLSIEELDIIQFFDSEIKTEDLSTADLSTACSTLISTPEMHTSISDSSQPTNSCGFMPTCEWTVKWF